MNNCWHICNDKLFFISGALWDFKRDLVPWGLAAISLSNICTSGKKCHWYQKSERQDVVLKWEYIQGRYFLEIPYDSKKAFALVALKRRDRKRYTFLKIDFRHSLFIVFLVILIYLFLKVLFLGTYEGRIKSKILGIFKIVHNAGWEHSVVPTLFIWKHLYICYQFYT